MHDRHDEFRPIAGAAAPLTGAIFTTNAACTGTNVNIFGSRDDVYVGGGPQNANAGSGLPDGSYYVKVTDPSGSTLLGTSVGSAAPTPVHVTTGSFDVCYQLAAIVFKASDASPGYDATPNNGDEYKVWISPNATFDPARTDNFKVREGEGVPPQATLNVNKFYDANADGINNDAQPITGWEVRIQDNIDFIRFTPVTITVAAPDDYTVTEFAPIETNWMRTTDNPVIVSLGDGENKTVEFGNLCLGAGGGLTLGFWSNKNGQSQFGADDLALMQALNLRNANGSDFNPTGYSQFRTWLLNATATNMAYMLSAQLAAMELSVLNNFVSGTRLVYAPGTTSANGLGFATVTNLMNEANAELALHGTTTSAGATRTYQEALKNALDNANNNKTFVQAAPCAFSFATT